MSHEAFAAAAPGNCQSQPTLMPDGSYQCAGCGYVIPAPTVVEPVAKPRKACYVGAPAIFALDLACKQINDAFGHYGCFLVGSAITGPGWRDVDVRFVMEDEAFALLFPNAHATPGNVLGAWEQDARWLLLTISISGWLSKVTGLPVDFQIQPMTHANKRHTGARQALGITVAPSINKEAFFRP